LLTLPLIFCSTTVLADVEARFEVPATDGGTREIVVSYLSPPGRMIDLGTHKLHIFCLGTGRPTIVAESGLGGFSLEWLKIQTDLSREFRICTYDRAGYAWSQAGPLPRTSEQLAEELDEMLFRAGESPPFLLVGHSFGGYVVQHFAKLNPGKTAGLVLIESSHPWQASRLPLQRPVGAMNTARERRQYVSWGPVHRNFPYEVRTLAYHFMRSRRATRTRRYEWSNLENSGAELAALGPLPDSPTIVLTRGTRVWPQTELGDAMELTWRELQRELVVSAPYAMQTVVPFSGHHIHLDQPWAVEDTIRTIARIAECRGPTQQLSKHVVLYYEAPLEC